MKSILIVLAFFLRTLFFSHAYAAVPSGPDFIRGLWWTEKKEAKVEIFREGDLYFGKLYWIKNDPDEHGKPQVDSENPDPKLRDRPMHDLVFIKNLKANPEGTEWSGGEVYNSDNGKTYRFKIRRIDQDPNHIKIRGYLGISLLGGSEIWTRTEP